MMAPDERVALAPPWVGTPADADYADTLAGMLIQHRTALAAALAELAPQTAALAAVAARLIAALRRGAKVLVAGNGGSAAEAQHFAAELVGRYRRERDPYAVIALSTDTSILTAVGNDYGFEQVFARQVRALGRRGDVFLGFSTSGESENLLGAARAGRERGLTVVAVTGRTASRLERLADVAIHVPQAEPAIAQEVHMVITHLLCDLVEAELARPAGEHG